MRTVDLPDGTTVTLRERADIRARDRMLIESAAIAAAPAIGKLPADMLDGTMSEDEVAQVDIAQSGLTRTEAASLLDMQSATIVGMLADWSRDEPLPTIDNVDELPADLYNALADVTKKDGAAIASRTDFDPHPGSPGHAAGSALPSPTVPSSGSVTSLRANPAPQSIEPQPSDSVSTTTAASSVG
jgi:hypothetical protein